MSPPAPPSPAIDVERAANLLEFYATSADRVGAVNDADLLRALAAALSSQPARIAEQPAAWAVFNVGGTLRGLYAARENAIDYANVVSGGRTVEPLYRAARSERDTGRDTERLNWLGSQARLDTPESLAEAEFEGAQCEGNLYFSWNLPTDFRVAIDEQMASSLLSYARNRQAKFRAYIPVERDTGEAPMLVIEGSPDFKADAQRALDTKTSEFPKCDYTNDGLRCVLNHGHVRAHLLALRLSPPASEP